MDAVDGGAAANINVTGGIVLHGGSAIGQNSTTSY